MLLDLYHTAVIGNIIDGRVLPDKTIWDKNMGSKIPELLSYWNFGSKIFIVTVGDTVAIEMLSRHNKSSDREAF